MQCWERQEYAGSPAESKSSLMDELWHALDEINALCECDVYRYAPLGDDADPLNDKGHIWSFIYFFFNKRLKRICVFSCNAQAKSALDQSRTTAYGLDESGDSSYRGEESDEGEGMTSFVEEMDL